MVMRGGLEMRVRGEGMVGRNFGGICGRGRRGGGGRLVDWYDVCEIDLVYNEPWVLDIPEQSGIRLEIFGG